VDAHCHVFGLGAEFPYAPERKYTPCDAGKAKLRALRDYLGFSRNVVVQATCHGADRPRHGRTPVSSSDGLGARRRHGAPFRHGRANLHEMDAAGVRGVRFNFVKRLVDTTPRDELGGDRHARREARLARGHLLRGSRTARTVRLHRLAPRHGGRGPHGPSGRPRSRWTVQKFALFEKLMADNPQVWSKVTCPDRLVRCPVRRTTTTSCRSRVAWWNASRTASCGAPDWPHPNLKTHMPDDGALVNLIPRIAPTAVLQQHCW
jgi:2-pyrone-4,6-dicarboxylate lactonase